ncbi:IS21 family transposase [Xanthomonas sp. NCPPB 2632]|uniref:IS21 family transposase n=1 Tax=Xanthomonas sp. NCPPB 2632 TaxID=3240912 RepID=UPI003510DA6A
MKKYDALRLILTTTLTDREIGASAGVSKTTVGRYRRLAEAKRLSWNTLAELGPDGIDRVVNRPRSGGKAKRIPDLSLLDDQLQTKGMTLQLIWEQMRTADPHTTPSYSHLAACLKRYRSTLPTVMRQRHVPGERVFVDYSGLRPFYIDRTTQEKVFVELFVGVLGASSLLFAMCTPSQKVPDFIRAHVAMLDYFGGVPMVVVPDNLKSAVVVAGRTPTIQRSYADLARHYGMAVLPARPYRPRDKASAEVGVKYAQQRILSRLHHQHFFSLDELNEEIGRLLEEANARPIVKDGVSRRARFEAIERLALKPLPAQPYAYADWIAVPKVLQDYHVAVEGHFYSVPHDLIGKRVDARVTDQTVEILCNRRKVAQHARSTAVGGHTTNIGHQPEAHRAQGERTPEGMLAWAKDAGPHVLRFVQHQVGGPQPFTGLPACERLRSLARTHGTAAVDQAARAAFEARSPTITTLKRLLDNAAVHAKQSHVRRSSYAQGPVFQSEEVTC